MPVTCSQQFPPPHELVELVLDVLPVELDVLLVEELEVLLVEELEELLLDELELEEQFVPPSQVHKHSLYFAIPKLVPLRCDPQALLQLLPPEPVEVLVGTPPAVFAFVLPVW